MAESPKSGRPGPLTDLKVLDLAGPIGAYCGKLLADLGADVVRIEPPGRDPMRDIGPFFDDDPEPEKSLYWWHFNTSKRGITLDLENPEGLEIFKRLVQWADIGMYQAGVMFMSEYIMDAQVNGREGGRIGNRHPYRAPQGCYRALGDDQWITLSVGDDEGWAGMCGLMGRPELATDAMYADLLSRQRNHDQIDEIITAWTSGVDRYELMHALQGIGIPAGPVLNSKDIHYDPQFKNRGFLERVDYPKERDMGSRMFIGRPWKFSNSPLAIQGPSPTFGQHNEDVLQGLLGVDADAYQSLVDDAVVATVPTTGEATPRVPELESLERGLLAGWDPDYLQKLGLA